MLINTSASAVEDSTTFGLQHSVRLQFGDLGGTTVALQRDFWAHSSLLVDAEIEQSLGLIGQHWWIRPVEERCIDQKDKGRAYAAKERFKCVCPSGAVGFGSRKGFLHGEFLGIRVLQEISKLQLPNPDEPEPKGSPM